METASSFFGGPLPPLPPQLAELPPMPVRPIQWRRLARALRELVADRQRTEKAFEIFEALGGDDDSQFRHFAASPEGQRLLEERPSLARLLADRNALGEMPEGSFGRAYLAFCEVNGFAADGLLRARDQAGTNLAGVGAARAWFADRITMAHDLWHVLTGYGTDSTGEIALLAFSRTQGLRSRAARFFSLLAALHSGRAVRRIARDAQRRGRAALPLILARYEELLPLPLEVVRSRLRIAPPRRSAEIAIGAGSGT